MKLIRQVALWNNDGNADKVYEIDLCETAPGRYVVNFRYGRRGSTLKDGTKTAMPVTLQQAGDIFEKLAAEKRKGGYRDTDNYLAEPSGVFSEPAAATITDDGLKSYVLRCLKEAADPNPGKIIEKWPLGRIIWRAGELRIFDAAPLIIPQLTKGHSLMQYSACWALGRCANPIAYEPLLLIHESKATAPHVKRIAMAALLAFGKINNNEDRLTALLTPSLPENIGTCLQNEEADTLKNLLLTCIATPESHKYVTTVYLLAEKFAAAKTATYELLKQIKLIPNQFKVARHIFKLAEFRDDAPVFSLLAFKFETTPGLFRYNRWNRNGNAFYNGKNAVKAIDEQKKENSTLAYSDTARNYFMRRVWRTMRTLGKDGDEAYVQFAYSALLQYNNGLAGKKEKETIEKVFYTYNTNTRSYESANIVKHYSPHANSHLLNYILYSGESRYQLKRNNRAWQLLNAEADLPASIREEPFANLWDQFPGALVQLLFDSEVEMVHNFAVKALTNRTDLPDFFNLEALKKILQKPFASTARFGLTLAEKMYDENNPDEELVIMLLLHPVPEARTMALKWVANKLEYFFRQSQVPVHLVVNPYADVYEAANGWLANGGFSPAASLDFCNRVIEQLLLLQPEISMAEAAAGHAARLLSTHFLTALGDTGINKVRQMLGHKIAAVEVLASIILLHHQVPPEQFPEGLLSQMIQSENAQVRQAGVTLFGRLPEKQLIENTELIAAFCVSPYAEIRTAIQPAVQLLNEKNKEFGAALVKNLLPYFHRKETYEGLHYSLYALFTQSLAEHLLLVNGEEALSFLHSRFAGAQQLGLFIIKKHNKAATFTMRQWVRMASHEVLEIRQFCQQLYNENIIRVQNEASESLRILDSSWDDSRLFGVDYFRKNFDENNWTPELLISVCDSTRSDVQSFGREMITRYFKEENGELYLLQLSQHPAQQVQHFTTHYLEQFAADKPVNIDKLEAYFITVLSQVNKAGVAKKRIFHFLLEEALKNRQVAQTVIKIMARQSATMSVSDKAACISIMHQLHKKYGDLEMPLTILPVEKYQPA